MTSVSFSRHSRVSKNSKQVPENSHHATPQDIFMQQPFSDEYADFANSFLVEQANNEREMASLG